MNWQKSAEADLKSYYSRKDSLNNIKLRIQALKESRESLRGAATDKSPVKGGASAIEDKLLNNLVESDRLKATYQATIRLVNITEKGLNYLNSEEREVIEVCYCNPPNNPINDLKERLGYEKTKIYAIRKEALYKFTIACYGLIDY